MSRHIAPENADERLMIAYLLGELSEKEAALVRQRLFTDEEFFERLQATEDELFDSYARREFSAREREQFERRLLSSPPQQQKLKFAQAFADVVSASTAAQAVAPPVTRHRETKSGRQFLWAWLPHNRAFQFSSLAASLVILCVAVWLFVESRRLRPQLAQLQTEQAALQQRAQELAGQATAQRARGDELAAQLDSEKNRPAQEDAPAPPPPRNERPTSGAPATKRPAVFSVLLAANVLRNGSAVKQVDIPRTAKTVELRLELEEQAASQSYGATLMSARGEQVLERRKLPARQTRAGALVVLQVPASLLAPGKYELMLSSGASRQSSEVIGYYYFNVTKN